MSGHQINVSFNRIIYRTDIGRHAAITNEIRPDRVSSGYNKHTIYLLSIILSPTIVV